MAAKKMPAKKMVAKKMAAKKPAESRLDQVRRTGGRFHMGYGPMVPVEGVNPGIGAEEFLYKSSDYIAKPRVKKKK